MGYKDGRERYGKVKVNQVWKKKDTGRIMRVVHKNSDSCWTVDYGEGTRKSSHVLKEKDIYYYYDRIDGLAK